MSGDSFRCFLIVVIFEPGVALFLAPGGRSEDVGKHPIMQKTVLQHGILHQIPTVPSFRNSALKGCPEVEGDCGGVTHGSSLCFFPDIAVAVVAICQALHQVPVPNTQYFMLPDQKLLCV